jgi:hypothetical protein
MRLTISRHSREPQHSSRDEPLAGLGRIKAHWQYLPAESCAGRMDAALLSL